MSQYAIITPTYIKHFKYIKKYLESFIKHVVDRDSIKLYFIISEAEKNKFDKIIKPYQTLCNITVLHVEDILSAYNIEKSSEMLLKEYGRFTFQTLKKLYGILYIEEEKSLILDSESMWINETNMTDLFNDFFESPTIYASRVESEFRTGKVYNQILNNINYLLGYTCPYWFLENYRWFYEKTILKDIISQHGSPIEMADKLKAENDNLLLPNDVRFGIFEILLYQNYIYKNISKYNYNFVDLQKEMEQRLGSEAYEIYKYQFYIKYKGECGFVGNMCMLLTKQNIQPLIQMCLDHHIDIMHCKKTAIDNYKLQCIFFKGTKPSILVSSQDHLFGLNATLEKRIDRFLLSNPNVVKLKKHLAYFVAPIVIAFKPIIYTIKWLLQPFILLKYIVRIIFFILKNLRHFL